MRNRLIFAYFFFITVEYCLRTFVELFKYHQTGFIIEFIPIVITTAITALVSRKIIVDKYFAEVYIKFSLISILGFFTAKTALFYQWYWILYPEYRNETNDMNEGLAWTIIFSIFGAISILVSYSLLALITKKNRKIEI